MTNNKHNHHYGPTLPLSEELDTIKYRQTGESFYDKCVRIADALKDSEQHFKDFKDALRNMRFLPAGRVQNAMGASRQTTAYNCFVMKNVPDDNYVIIIPYYYNEGPLLWLNKSSEAIGTATRWQP